MPRVKIEDLKPDARVLNKKEMKKLYGGLTNIDISGAVNKYVGETEANLSKTFAAAESSNVILTFDEADDLFGKR